jgi:biopolymer transport protein ExbB
MTTLRTTLALIATAVALLGTPAHAAWNRDFPVHTRITLDTTDKGLALPAAQSDVVVPVRLHSGNFDFAAAKPDGSDLRVIAADDKTPLPFEVERFDGVNELALLWVHLDQVLPGTDKNVIHVYAGNPAANPEGRAQVFASKHAVVLHFSEQDGPAVDDAGSLKSTAPVLRETNGLLAASARLDATPIALPADARLRVAAGGTLTLALWIKPEAATAPATLAALGPVKLLRRGDQLAAEIGATSLAGGSLPAGAWAHVGLVLAGGKATLFVNGKQAAQVDAAAPEADAGLQVGTGYRGLVDELQVLPAARDEGWFRLQAAAQGADPGFVKSGKDTAAETEEGGSTGYMGILLKNLTSDAWVVIAILLAMFAVAMWVMVTKALAVRNAARANDAFMGHFRAENPQAPRNEREFAKSPLFRLYRTGLREVGKRQRAGRTMLSGASLDAIKAVLDADLVRENHSMNARMVLLTIAISGGPFLGLLGTVVGVMITFAAIAAAGDVNVNAIAPGIAAALLATVAGLGVAIPALFGYNYLAARIKTLSADMQIFVDEFVTRAAEAQGES